MTKQEAEKYLNSMLIPFSENEESIKANGTLTSAEEDKLLQIVIDFKAWSAQIKAQNKNIEIQNKNIEAQNKKIELQNKKMRESVGNFEIEKLKRKIERSKVEIEKSKAEIEELIEKIGCQKALADVAGIMKRYVKPAQTTNGGTKIPVQPSAMPFLIKQVLFFIMVSYIEYELPHTQKDILKLLREQHGVNISHNFFSRMKTTPIEYWNMIKYQQPELPINYQGQKHGELAVAIKNLVYQAGKYDVFCDVFGGSGAALLAVDRRKDSKYVYNELHRCLYNLFVVMADSEKHKELIEKLEEVQIYLRDGGDWPEDIDIEQGLINYFGSANNHSTDREVALDGGQDINYDFTEIIEYMQKIRGLIVNNIIVQANTSFQYGAQEYDRNRLLNEIFPNNPTDEMFSFSKNSELIHALYKKYGLFNPIYEAPPLEGEYYSIMDKMDKKLIAADSSEVYKQYRFYEYYLYLVESLRKVPGRIAPDNSVIYAVAEIFNRFFTINGFTSVSPLRGMLDPDNTKRNTNNKNDNPDEFLEQPFRELILNVHKYSKGTICHCMDCRDLINRYRSDSEQSGTKYNNPLFYVDSPYEGTKGYADEENGISEFTPDDMKELICTLRDSNNKFIFSCRAVAGQQKKGAVSKEKRKTNIKIKTNVFDVFNKQFIDKGRPLWVLAIEENGSLGNLIKKNVIIELMICNFEICNFVDKDYNNIGFKVYTYQDFLQIWDDNAAV